MKNTNILIRVTTSEKDKANNKAKKLGYTLSEFTRLLWRKGKLEKNADKKSK